MMAGTEPFQDIVTTRRRKMAGHGLPLHSYNNVLGARRRKKDGEAEEDMAKCIQRRPGRDGCQLACSLQDRQ